MNMNILAIDITTMSTYDFLQDGETEEQLLERANISKKRDIDSWEKNCKQYPNTPLFEGYLTGAKKKNYKVVTWEEFEKLQRDFYTNRPLEETTKNNSSIP